MLSKKTVGLAGMIGLGALTLSQPASALSISINSAVLNGTNTVNGKVDSLGSNIFGEMNQLVLSNLTGTQTITLSFTWTSTVNLPTATAATGNDELAIRLGLAGIARAGRRRAS